MRLGFDRLLGVPLAGPDLDVGRIQMAGKWIIMQMWSLLLNICCYDVTLHI
jgi:hypothetical protein